MDVFFARLYKLVCCMGIISVLYARILQKITKKRISDNRVQIQYVYLDFHICRCKNRR